MALDYLQLAPFAPTIPTLPPPITAVKWNVEVEDNTTFPAAFPTQPGGMARTRIDVVDTAPAFLIEIEDNDIQHMGHDGIRLRGDIQCAYGRYSEDNDIDYCLIDGIEVQFCLGSNTFKENDCDHNGQAGIFVTGSIGAYIKRTTRGKTT